MAGGAEKRWKSVLPWVVSAGLLFYVFGYATEWDRLLGAMEQADANVDPPLHSAGVGIDAVFLPVCQIDEFQNFIDPFVKCRAAHTVHFAKKG